MSKPYFETKVVKVKKKERPSVCPDNGRAICLTCGEKLYHIEKPKPQPKGNWVNGENLDKIKFPCFCRWNHNIGMIIYDFWDIPRFTLIKIDKQTNKNHTYSHSKSLEKLKT